MSNEAEAGRVIANAVELTKTIMERVVSNDVRPPKSMSRDQTDEAIAAKIVSNLSNRAGV
jgi:hypothetical protein